MDHSAFNHKNVLSHVDIVECKKSEDEAIGIVNACNKNSGGRMLVSNFRSFMDQEEDYNDEDYDLYDDDYYNFDEDYYY